MSNRTRGKIYSTYCDELIKVFVENQLEISLVPAQVDVLRDMLSYDYVLFRHGRGVGATFLLSSLSAILRLIDPGISMAVTAPTVRQAKMIDTESEQRFGTLGLAPLNIVTIEEAISGEYDVVLIDEATHLAKKYIESLIKHVEDRSISKIVTVCGGHRPYYPISKLAQCMCREANRVVLSKCYEDMPASFFDKGYLKEVEASFDYKEEFWMEYKGFVI